MLLGETLLKDSLDPNCLIACCGIKGLLWYSPVSQIDFWSEYIPRWLCHEKWSIREACLVGFEDVLRRYHYGWNYNENEALFDRTDENETSGRNLKELLTIILPILQSLAEFVDREMVNEYDGANSEELRRREIDIVRTRAIAVLELYPLICLEE
jgi:hypothetical protein